MLHRPLAAIVASLVFMAGTPASSEPTPPEEVAPSSQPAKAAGADPFSKLKPVVSRSRLPPLASVRERDKLEAASRRGTITITIGTAPKGAAVYYGGKLLGATPLTLTAPRGSTPFDVVIRHGGYMTLHTRIMRKVTRGYFFKLSPAKLR